MICGIYIWQSTIKILGWQKESIFNLNMEINMKYSFKGYSTTL